jgi:DNA-directed RNA polymerase specialized sigma24 family protein
MPQPEPIGRVILGTRTTTRLLDDLRDRSNAPAWEAFDARYRPILTAFAHRLGFAGEDAAELAQQTLAEFSRAYAQGRYQRGQGRLSSWLIGIASHVGSGMRRRVGRGPKADAAGDPMDDAWSDQRQLQSAWDRERERAIVLEAMAILKESSRMQASTLLAFELFAIRGVPAEEVAAQCNISVDAVYVVKNRLTGRLREIVRELTIAYDEGE